MKIVIVGAGYVGLVTGVCLAELGHDVVCLEADAAKAASISAGTVPFHEPGLPETLARVLEAGRFRAEPPSPVPLREADLVFIATGTPSVDGRIDLRAVEAAAEQIGRARAGATGRVVVALRSTAVPGTTEGLVAGALARATGRGRGDGWDVAANPEFLREGSALEDFRTMDRLVIGATSDWATATVEEAYAGLDCPVVRTTPLNAELAKYTSNVLLATMVSFANELATICESLPGADVGVVLDSLALDRRLRVGGQPVEMTTYLRAGIGFGGSCLPKDLEAITAFARDLGVEPIVLDAVRVRNERRGGDVVDLLRRRGIVLAGARVAVLGLAFKQGTDDTRRSPSGPVVAALRAAGAEVVAHDPLVTGAAWGDPALPVTADLGEALEGADAAVLAAGWDEYRHADWPALAARMRHPVLLDGRRLLDASALPTDVGLVRIGVCAGSTR